MELAAAQERQQEALRAERRAVELRAAELMAAEREAAEPRRGGLSRSSSEMMASSALAQASSAGRSQDSLVGGATLREAMRSVSISSEAPSSALAEPHTTSGVGQGAGAAAASPQQVLTLANVGDKHPRVAEEPHPAQGGGAGRR